jgi:hypothetical protein
LFSPGNRQRADRRYPTREIEKQVNALVAGYTR